MFDIDQLSTPISEEFPTGHDLRLGGDTGLYFRLKDLRSSARAEDRNIEPGQRLSADWAEIEKLALAALEKETRDIEILAWLAEAELRLHGFKGLGRTFALIARLVEADFDGLYSIEGDIDDKVAPISGLNGVNSEGALIKPLRFAPLVPGQAFLNFGLWEFQLAQRPNETERRARLEEVATAAGRAGMRAHLADVKECIRAFAAMTAAFDSRCGAAAPASTMIRSVLEEARLAVMNIGGLEHDEPEALPEAESEVAAVAEVGAKGLSAGPIRSRQQALERLSEIAEYFRRHEPHSPLAAALDTAVLRGRMSFTELLAELVVDDNARHSILVTAGIRPEKNG